MLRFLGTLVWILTFVFSSWVSAEDSAKWETLKNCRLVENESNDADSFHVEHNGQEYIFRLYFADSPESELDGDVAGRVTEQAGHFGVTEEQSLKWGKEATKFTRRVLSRPFTVVTRFQKAMGRSKMQRYYAVILPDGKRVDLAEMLVTSGLARAHGQVVSAPNGKKMEDYKRMEKRAKSQKMGIYGGGKPVSIVSANEEEPMFASREEKIETPSANDHGGDMPEVGVSISDAVYGAVSDSLIGSISQLEVVEKKDNNYVSDSKPSANSSKVNINSASKSELDGLPGIGEVLAESIISGRPYKDLEDLKKVPKLGDAAIQRLASLVEF
jgi:competence ComEA-like helix-hairpin-helix protein